MKKLWSDLHSNIHHNQMKDLDAWINHARKCIDFWPIAYYPFRMVKDKKTGATLEDLWDEDDINKDWEIIREVTKRENEKGFPMFMGYEWQGSGLDGDHNVFFKDNNQKMAHPHRYEDLYNTYKDIDAIAIPHHLAYQKGSRGKNWDTNIEAFSPFAEIYSSHGCSENDTGPMDMERHLHMGPRTEMTSYEEGLRRNTIIGCIASGDNHDLPAISEHGLACAIAKSNSKDDIWDALTNRRVYGVSRSKMDIDFMLDNNYMGSVISSGAYHLNINVVAADAIDRIEILRNNILENMIVHSGSWERNIHNKDDIINVKFAAEFGWGPNPNFYPDMLVKKWEGSLSTTGKIVDIEKLWNNYGQSLEIKDEKSCNFELTTYMSTHTGHWMGPSKVSKEGFVFELSGRLNDKVILDVNGHSYEFTIEELMEGSRILVEYEESINLAKKVYGEVEHYRDDFYWHNAYKIRLRRAVPQNAYTVSYNSKINMEAKDNLRLRIHLKNGDTAWTSPIFVK